MKSFSVEVLDTGFVYRSIHEEYGREKQTQKAFTTKQELIKFLEGEL